MSISVQRALCVLWPHRIGVFCSQRVTYYTVFTLAAIMSVYAAPFLFITDSALFRDRYICISTAKWFSEVYMEIHAYLIGFGSNIVIIVANILLVYGIRGSKDDMISSTCDSRQKKKG